MVNIEFGQIVFSKAGHDKETAYVVLGEEKGKIILADGRYKTLENPKIKNVKHLQPTNYIEDSLAKKQELGLLRNEDIKRCIKLYLKSNI